MVLVMMASEAPVEIHRARSCAEEKDRCSDLAVGGVQALVECTLGEGWELVVDRVHLIEIAVE